MEGFCAYIYPYAHKKDRSCRRCRRSGRNLLGVLFSAVRPNRGKRQYKTAFIAGAVATFICDIVWFFKYFDNFTYLEPDFKGFAWLLLLPAALLVLVMFQSYFNIGRFEHEQRQRIKETEKQRKKDSRRKKYDDMPPPPPPAPER